jgi:hypothetical protein
MDRKKQQAIKAKMQGRHPHCRLNRVPNKLIEKNTYIHYKSKQVSICPHIGAALGGLIRKRTLLFVWI